MEAAFSYKRDLTKCSSVKIKNVADGMTEEQLEDFASKQKTTRINNLHDLNKIYSTIYPDINLICPIKFGPFIVITVSIELSFKKITPVSRNILYFFEFDFPIMVKNNMKVVVYYSKITSNHNLAMQWMRKLRVDIIFDRQ